MYYYKFKNGKGFKNSLHPLLPKIEEEMTDEEKQEIAEIIENSEFVEITEQEFKALNEAVNGKFERIKTLKRNLAKTDYQAIKFAEGMMSAEEYAPIKAQRQEWRDEINSLENN